MLSALVLVAWADGKLDDREREAILKAARARGLAAERVAGPLLDKLLAQPPDPKLLTQWKSYVTRLWGRFTAGERWQMRQNLLGSARGGAEAAGGFLGVAAKISPEAGRVLEAIARVLGWTGAAEAAEPLP